MKRKKILYVGGFILPDKNAAAQRVISNAKAIKEIGFEVVFLGKSKDSTLSVDQQNPKKFDDFEIYEESYPEGVFNWIKHLSSNKNVETLVEKIGAGSIHTIIAYNYPSLALLKLLKYAKKHKIKVVSDCTEWAVESNRFSMRSLLKNMDTYYRMKKVHQKLDGMITISKFLYDFYNPKMKNVIFLPPLVDVEDRKWQGLGEVKELELTYAGSPGNGNKDRLDNMIDALSIVKDKLKRRVRLKIIGLSRDQFKTNFVSYNIPDNMKDDVVFLGRVPHIEAVSNVQKACFSIFFRENNIINTAGFPTKFVESISCGTPVITNNSSNLADYLSDKSFGRIINLKEKSQMETALSEVLSLPFEKINQMKQECFHSRKFHYKDYIREFQKLITNLH